MSGGKRLGVVELLKLRFLRIPVAAPYKLRDMAQDTVALMDHLRVRSAHIVGASMGGMIAQEIAITFPERVRSLTSIMSTTGNPKVPPPTREAASSPPPPVRETADWQRLAPPPRQPAVADAPAPADWSPPPVRRGGVEAVAEEVLEVSAEAIEDGVVYEEPVYEPASYGDDYTKRVSRSRRTTPTRPAGWTTEITMMSAP